MFDLDLVPDLKAALVTHAYQTFFDRTLANFEALVEGRDIRIGKPTDEPSPLPVEQLMPLLQKIGEMAMPLVQNLVRTAQLSPAEPRRSIDADGFTHITPMVPEQQQATEPDYWITEIGRFLDGFGLAAQRDLTYTNDAA